MYYSLLVCTKKFPPPGLRFHNESLIEGLLEYVKQEEFTKTPRVVEQYGQSVRLSLPFDDSASPVPLGKLFGSLERNKDRLSIAEYCVGTTTLEQIFLQFASEQEGAEVTSVSAGPDQPAFTYGDKVSWIKSDEDIPSGATGIVIGLLPTLKRVRCKFDSCTQDVDLKAREHTQHTQHTNDTTGHNTQNAPCNS